MSIRRGTVDTTKLLDLRGDRSVKEVCGLANVSPAVYSKIETGGNTDPRVSEIYRIAKALDVPLETLLHSESTAPQPGQ
jgi:transcriptional regulator with XRE-family HTH domain